jgi:uncharacterized UPF0160 family protein
MKIIVTHVNPDLDAICAIWLLKKFHGKFSNAELRFVPAGEIYHPTEIEKLKALEIIHVDTGADVFDHHQTSSLEICAATLVLDYLIKNKHVGEERIQPLKRLVNIVLEIDHFKEIFWEDPANDRYDFFLEEILRSLKLIWQGSDERVVNFGMEALDAIYQKMQNKIRAEEDIRSGKIVETPQGKIIGIETTNDEVVKLAQKKGFQIVIRKDSRKGYVRIKTIPNGKIDLTRTYSALQKSDPTATWFLHSSKCMILNGSTKNPNMKPTKLALNEIIEIVKDNV